MAGWDGPDAIELVARRIDVLETLADGPRRKRDAVEDLDASRSTLDRAVRELTDAGLVARVPDGYVTTPTGRLAARRYRAFVDEQTAIFSARPALSALPEDARLPVEVVVGAEVVTADGDDDPVETVLSTLRTAETYRAALPRVADTRHVRLCHARVVREALSVTLLAGPELVDRLEREFPVLADGLASAEYVELAAVDTPDYGIVLAETSGTTSVLVLAFEGEDLSAVIRTDDADAVAWAEERIATLDADADPLADRLRAGDGGSPDATPLTAAAALNDEGFVRVDGDYFARQVPNDPASAWRTGFELVDVYYDLALERVGTDRPAGDPRDEDVDGDDDRPLAATLVERLREAGDHVVVGPPGVGKSTLCRGVACRWVGAELGDVLYRTAPALGAVDRIGPLVDAVERDPGHTLVVVEDAATEGVAAPVGELVERYRDDVEVTFLLEARGSEWSELAESSDRLARALARGRVTEFRPPGIDEAECRRAIEAFEAATGRSVPLSAADLHDRVSTEGGAGEAYLLAHHLVSSTEPLPWTGDGATGLDADVAATYDALLEATDGDDGAALVDPDPTLPAEAGILVAVLTAAELSVDPALVHALAVTREGEPDDRGVAHRNVERVLDWLGGRLVFGAREDGTLRTRHPYWAVRFLERAVERDEREARHLFERAVSALFGLACDPDGRGAVASWVGRDSPALDRFEDPGGVGELVERVFGLAVEHSALVPLFSTSDRSGIELPAAAGTGTKLSCSKARFDGWYDHGSFDRARHEADHLRQLATEASDLDARTRARYESKALRGKGEIAEDRGQPEAAREQFRAALSALEGAGLDRAEISIRNAIGWLATTLDEYDRAREHLTTAMEIGDDVGVCRERTTTRYYLGNLAWFRGDLEAAERHLERARDLDRRLGDRQGEAMTLNALGLVAEDRDALDRAEGYYRESLSINREVRMRSDAAKTLYNLGDLLVKRDDLDAAEDCLDRSMAEFRELGMDRLKGNATGGFGRLERERGNYGAALEYHRRQREIHDGVDYERGVATADRDLGDLARARDNREAAVEHYEESVERFQSIDAPGEALSVVERLVEVERERDEPRAAAGWCETGVDIAADAGLDERAERFRGLREDVAASTGD